MREKPRGLNFSVRLLTLICLACLMTERLLSNSETRHVLKSGNELSCEIVAPAEAGSVAVFAGKELQKYLSRSLGAEPPLVNATGGQKTAIILGDTKQLREAGVDVSKLPRDGFVIKSSGNNILIAGRDDMKINMERALKSGGYWASLYERGTLFGAYEFLERFVGVRFYFPGEIGVVIPRHENLSAGAIDIFEKPDSETRRTSYGGTGHIDWVPDEKEAKLLSFCRMRLETKYIPNCHGLARLGYLERFGKTHPEYFALRPDGKRYMEPSMPHTGQLCLSSGIREEIYKDAEAFLSGRPAESREIITRYGPVWDPSGFQPGYFNIMPQDSFYPCRCEKCQAHFSKGPQATSDFVWGLVLEVSEKLKKNNIPGHVTMMAYSPYRMLPAITLPDNVMVMLALAGPWYMDKADYFEREVKLTEEWADKMRGNKPWAWNYTCKFGKLAIPNIPASTPRCIGKYYNKMSPHIIGAYLEADGENDKTENYIFNYLNLYVFGKVMWKNSTDVDALLKEHHRLMFGAAAPQMEQIFDAFEEKWLKITGNTVETSIGPHAIPLSEYDIWEKVYSKAEMDRLEKLFDCSDKATAADSDSNKRVRFIRERFFGPLEAQRAEYARGQIVVNDLRFWIKELPAGAKLTIDGKPDEAEWKGASQISLVPRGDEKSKKESDVMTTVKAMRDGGSIYFAFECEEPEISALTSSKKETAGAETDRGSAVEIFLNPSGDKNIYYRLLISPDGSLSDFSGSKEDNGAERKWSGGAAAAALKGKDSWTAEVSIPVQSLSGIDFSKGFPANFVRSRRLPGPAKDYASLSTWSPFLRGGFNDIDNFGCLTFKDSAGADIIKNGSFTGMRYGPGYGWLFGNRKNMKDFESVEISRDLFTESGKCIRLTRTASEKGAVKVTQYLSGLKPDTVYRLSYSVKIEGLSLLPESNDAGVVVNIWDDKNTWWPKNFYSSDMPWTKQGFQIKTGPNTNKPPHNSYIQLVIMDASGTACFGDVRLSEIACD